jgi:hypothetical protein
MEPEGSLLCSQQLTIGSYQARWIKSTPSYTISLWFILILSSTYA